MTKGIMFGKRTIFFVIKCFSCFITKPTWFASFACYLNTLPSAEAPSTEKGKEKTRKTGRKTGKLKNRGARGRCMRREKVRLPSQHPPSANFHSPQPLLVLSLLISSACARTYGDHQRSLHGGAGEVVIHTIIIMP